MSFINVSIKWHKIVEWFLQLKKKAEIFCLIDNNEISTLYLISPIFNQSHHDRAPIWNKTVGDINKLQELDPF